jgi:hypothetical protein
MKLGELLMSEQESDFKTSDKTAENLASIFKYPSLDSLFEGDGSGLTEMRQRLMRTNQELERLIRHGSTEDARRATMISRAYQVTLSLLDEIEASRKGLEKKS